MNWRYCSIIRISPQNTPKYPTIINTNITNNIQKPLLPEQSSYKYSDTKNSSHSTTTFWTSNNYISRHRMDICALDAFIAMRNLIITSFNPATRIVQDHMTMDSIPNLIQHGTNHYLQTMIHELSEETIILESIVTTVTQQIIDKHLDITNIETFQNSIFLGIALFKLQNIFDTRRFALACLNFYVTPAMVGSRNITELFNYAHNVRKHPRILIPLFIEGAVNPNFDYYPRFLNIMSAFNSANIQE